MVNFEHDKVTKKGFFFVLSRSYDAFDIAYRSCMKDASQL